MNRLVFVVLLTLLIVLGCIYPYLVERRESRSRPTRVVNALNLTTHNGTVDAGVTDDTIATVVVLRYAYGRSKADAEQRLERVTVVDTLEWDNWTVRVDVSATNQPLGASLTASAPGRVPLTISTSNGKVTVAGYNEGVRVNTSNGEVNLTGTGGDAAVFTSNAPVRVQVHSGGLTVKTSNGAIDADIAFLPAVKEVELETSNGDVTLRLPPDVSATITASTDNGTVVVSGLSVEYEEQSQRYIRGRIGSGAAPVKIGTSNGDIVIQSRF